MKTLIGTIMIALLAAFAARPASAHKISDSYLRLQVEGSVIHGEWDISLPDLAATAGLDDATKNDPEAVRNFALDNLMISSGAGRCTFRVAPPAKKRRNDDDTSGPDVEFAGECPGALASLSVNYSPFLAIDPQYREMVNITAGEANFTTALSAENSNATFQLAAAPDRAQPFRDYLREGVWHIWLGYDHILFLVSLLLSAAFVIAKGAWQPRDGFTGTLLQALKIVTAFTVAHSITLGLVIFDVISLPSRLVESAIALSIAIAAANNLRPVLQRRLWLLTFGFGLIHGMGFASALKQLGIPADARWVTLVAFNLGVELGQVSIVIAVLPLIYGMRNSPLYRNAILKAASVLIILMAMLWFIQRAFAITLLNGTLGT